MQLYIINYNILLLHILIYYYYSDHLPCNALYKNTIYHLDVIKFYVIICINCNYMY